MNFELLFIRPSRVQPHFDSDSSQVNFSPSWDWADYSAIKITNRLRSCWPWGFDQSKTA